MKKILAFFFFWWLMTLQAAATITCSLPFTLTNGTPADATQVMANYNALVTCFTQAASAGANNDITSLTGLSTPITPPSGGSSIFIGGTSGGTANAQTVTSTTPTGFGLTAGYRVTFTAGFTNTGAMTLNVNSQGATNVFRMSPSGPQALTGGEVVAGNVVEVIYDGTRFELVSQHTQFGGFGTQTSSAATATTDLGLFGTHNALLTGTTGITSFGSSASTTFPVYNLKFSGALTITYNATSMILPGTANITTAANDTATALYLGSGNWQITNYSKASGAAVLSGAPLCMAQGLSIATSGNTSIDFAWDGVTLLNSSNVSFISTTPSTATLNSTTNGVNAWDTGSRPTSNWGNVYIISDGTAVQVLGSASATAPTMPGSYDYRCRVGAFRFDGSQNLVRSLQKGNVSQYVVTTTAAAPIIASGASGSTTTPTWTSTAITTYVPPTATRIKTILFGTFDNSAGLRDIMLAPSNTYGAITSGTNPAPCSLGSADSTGNNMYVRTQCELVLQGTTVFYAGAAAAGANGVAALGWVDKVNAN